MSELPKFKSRMLALVTFMTAIALTAMAQDKRPSIAEEGHLITAGEESAFWKWIKSEGLPVDTGYVIDDVTTVRLGPWKRLGVSGAVIYLNGDGGQMAGYIAGIDPAQKTAPERHIYEEHIYVISGSGETVVWQEGRPKVTAKWKRGTLFSVPLNTWHEHVNTGTEPVRLIGLSNSPLVIDLFRNLDFVFQNNFRFTERFDGQSNFFDPVPSKMEPPSGHRHSYSITNLVPDVYTVKLFPAGHGLIGTGVGTIDTHFEMANDTLDAHVEEWQPGVYERGHRHGAGDNVLIIRGKGYSLMWPATAGTRPFAEGHGDQVIRVDWHPMTLFVPPLGWYHQHFNTSSEGARFVKLDGWENRVYPLTSKQTFNQTAISIEYQDEDPKMREMYQAELKKAGIQFRMPSLEELRKQK